MTEPFEHPALKSLQTEECPTAETLLAYLAATQEERRKFSEFSHIECCMYCQSVLRSLDEAEPETVEERRAWKDAASKLASLPSLSPQSGQPGSRRISLKPWMAVAAAVLLAAVMLPWILQRDERPSDQQIRGGEIQLLSPAATTAWPFEFRWSSPVEAARFRLEIQDDSNQIVYRAETQAERLPSGDRLRSLLKPGTTYRWRVLALDTTDEVILASNFQSFKVAP